MTNALNEFLTRNKAIEEAYSAKLVATFEDGQAVVTEPEPSV